jgi:3-isopropylmalate dehydrogenase
MTEVQTTPSAPAAPGLRAVRWSPFVSSVFGDARAFQPHVIGVLGGEGVGREVLSAALEVLAAVASVSRCPVTIEKGGAIGIDAERTHGRALSNDVIAFCEQVYSRGGAILAGPGGGRFVYDMRSRFDLFCKLSPLIVHEELLDANHMKPEQCRGVDILVVRENCSGVYQGRWTEETTPTGSRRASHEFWYEEGEVRRIMEVGARIAVQRRGELAVIHKKPGVPTISGLWIDVANEVARDHGLKLSLLEVDYAAYALLQRARLLDVIVAGNLFGDIISDLGGVLVGSRGVCYSGNFAPSGAAVYQTNHGAAYDLAGQDLANPAGHIFALAMLLRESFGLLQAAELTQRAVRTAWARGWRTADVAVDGCRLVGTREMGSRIAAIAVELGSSGG